MIVIIGNKNSNSLESIWRRMVSNGICVPKTTNVPLEIVSVNLEDGILSDSQNIRSVEKMAHTKKIIYEYPYPLSIIPVAWLTNGTIINAIKESTMTGRGCFCGFHPFSLTQIGR